jgi:hypothetical protein
MDTTLFDNLTTHEDVSLFIDAAYQKKLGDPSLPLAVAEPGPLIERAVEIAGQDGMTLQQVRALFGRLGKERLERGLDMARVAGRVTEVREKRPNRAGRLQEQVVLRAQDGG